MRQLTDLDQMVVNLAMAKHVADKLVSSWGNRADGGPSIKEVHGKLTVLAQINHDQNAQDVLRLCEKVLIARGYL